MGDMDYTSDGDKACDELCLECPMLKGVGSSAAKGMRVICFSGITGRREVKYGDQCPSGRQLKAKKGETPEEKAKLERGLICIIHLAVEEFDNPGEAACAKRVYGEAIIHLGMLHGLSFTGKPEQEVAEFVKENKGLWT